MSPRRFVEPLWGSAILVLIVLPAFLVSGGPSHLPADGSCSPGLALYASPAGGVAPVVVTFDLVSTVGPVSSLSWQFGDGSSLGAGGAPEYQPAHRYSSPGLFRVVANVSGPSGEGSCTLDVEVTAAALVANITSDHSDGRAPLTVHLAAIITGGTGTFGSENWSFGDGGTATGTSASYTYFTPGTYHVRFAVADSSGATANASLVIRVEAATTGTASGAQGPQISQAGILAAGVGAGVLAGAWAYLASVPSLVVAQPAVPTEVGRRPRDGRSLTGQSLAHESRPHAAEPRTGVEHSGVIRTGGPVRPQLSELRIHEQVLIHLARMGRTAPNAIAPLGATQKGMAADTGIPRNQLSTILRRLALAGLVAVRLEHVVGEPRRLKAYELTEKGAELARQLWRSMPSEANATRWDRSGAPQPSLERKVADGSDPGPN